MILYLYRA